MIKVFTSWSIRGYCEVAIGVNNIEGKGPLLTRILFWLELPYKEDVVFVEIDIDWNALQLKEIIIVSQRLFIVDSFISVEFDSEVGSEEIGFGLSRLVEHGGETVESQVVGRWGRFIHRSKRVLDLSQIELELA